MISFWICLILSLPYLSNQASTKDSPDYVAGVVEFKVPTTNNLEQYIQIIESRDAAETDIIVFPEATLNNVHAAILMPEEIDFIPCGNDTYDIALSKISCAAKTAKKYIIINISEKSKCTIETQKQKKDPRPCSPSGFNIFNSNVVFDRTGKIISRYRKWNLFGEVFGNIHTNTTYEPEYGMFETDFGVKFGHFICFDLMFYTPAQNLIKSGITDFVYPTMWFSELPYLTAVQAQQSWAEANQVNFLAAGASHPSVGSTGSGIYAGRNGAIVSSMNFNDGQTKIYVARVKKNVRDNVIPAKELPNYKSISYKTPEIKLKRDDIESYKTELLKFDSDILDKSYCYEKFCCHFYIKRKSQNITDIEKSYQYRLAVYSGNRTYAGHADGWLQFCGIISCTNDTVASCATLFPNDVNIKNDIIFENIEIESEFNYEIHPKMLIMTTSLDMNLLPLNPKSYQADRSQSSASDRLLSEQLKFKLKEPRSDLLTFAVYANIYERSSSGLININVYLFTILLIAVIALSKYGHI